MYLKNSYIMTAIAALILGACSSTPERIEVLEQASEAVAEVSAHPDAQQVAGDELADATEALQNAQYLRANNGDYDDIYHQAYLALRNAEIAKERIAEAHARERIKSSEAERARILLAAREADANRAIARAERSELAAELAQERAEMAIAQQRHLRATLLELEAEKTDRGYVLTLSDILFDTDKAVLKPGAQKTMDTLAEFMREYPEHRLLIEGHTDSRGTDAYNIALSESRANAVRLALLDRGIDPGRLEIAAMGENYPLASNDTSAGMQENRRVEIIFSDTEGNFPAAVTRTASNY